MMSREKYIELAQSLPAALRNFFARWPPTGIGIDIPPTVYQKLRPDPFEFYVHPVTGRKHDPVYSARRQALLFGLARDHGVLDLMPKSAKHPEVSLANRVEHGLRVKGTGVGQQVKGHIHERHMIAKMEKRRKAMLDMSNLIKAWKTVGKKNWTKFPK